MRVDEAEAAFGQVQVPHEEFEELALARAGAPEHGQVPGEVRLQGAERPLLGGHDRAEREAERAGGLGGRNQAGHGIFLRQRGGAAQATFGELHLDQVVVHALGAEAFDERRLLVAPASLRLPTLVLGLLGRDVGDRLEPVAEPRTGGLDILDRAVVAHRVVEVEGEHRAIEGVGDEAGVRVEEPAGLGAGNEPAHPFVDLPPGLGDAGKRQVIAHVVEQIVVDLACRERIGDERRVPGVGQKYVFAECRALPPGVGELLLSPPLRLGFRPFPFPLFGLLSPPRLVPSPLLLQGEAFAFGADLRLAFRELPPSRLLASLGVRPPLHPELHAADREQGGPDAGVSQSAERPPDAVQDLPAVIDRQDQDDDRREHE